MDKVKQELASPAKRQCLNAGLQEVKVEKREAEDKLKADEGVQGSAGCRNNAHRIRSPIYCSHISAHEQEEESGKEENFEQGGTGLGHSIDTEGGCHY